MAARRAVLITGFMGSGKSTVGPLVAARLGRTFVDLDRLIEGLSGRSIPALFEEGEPRFRHWEQLALAKLDLGQALVVATGGGTLVGEWNRMRAHPALVVVLDVPLEVARARVAGGGDRPVAGQLDALYVDRAAAYARLPHHLPTAGRTPDQVAAAVVALVQEADEAPEAINPRGTILHVAGERGGYDVNIQPGVAAGIGGYVKPLQPGRVALISDDQVGRLWGETVRHDLMAAALPTTRLTMPAGETHKTLATAGALYDGLAAAGIGREDTIVALGGGVVGDTAGFVSGSWMRGVRGLVQLPTTLLAMVDASVGGKTGVDHPSGKNLIGLFRAPDLVLIDPIFLTTLPLAERRNGMAEVIKHAVLSGESLMERLRALPHSLEMPAEEWAALIADAVAVKAAVVARDPYEQGERATLNLGHTFGHAYEHLSGYRLAHGQAVAIGMMSAARLSERLGLATGGLADEIGSVLKKVGLPTHLPEPVDAEAVLRVMQQDKKRGAAGLRLVLPRAIGDVVVTAPGAVESAAIREAIEESQ